MGIKLWKQREDLGATLIEERHLKCNCTSRNNCTCGMKINEFIKNTNYFQCFNGLENILLVSNNPKDFCNKISVEDFQRLYSFDRQLSSEIFKLLNIFEEKLQNSISYHFTKAYCSTLDDTMQYTNKLNYKDISNEDNYPFSGEYQQYFKIINEFNAKYRNGNNKFLLFDSFYLKNLVKNYEMIDPLFYKDNLYNAPTGVCVYRNDPKVAVPFWVAIQSTTFGTLKYLCHYLKDSEMDLVLKDFGLTKNQRYMFLSVLDVINELRNQCAHGTIIFKFKTPEYIKLNNNLVSTYNLSPRHGSGTRTTPYSVIYLFDALKILSHFVSVKSIYKIFKKFTYTNNHYLKKDARRVNDNILKAINADSYTELKQLS